MLWYFGGLETLRKANISRVQSVSLSVCPDGTPRQSVNRFTRKFMSANSVPIPVPEQPNFVKIGHFALRLCTFTILWLLTSLRLCYQVTNVSVVAAVTLFPLLPWYRIVTNDSCSSCYHGQQGYGRQWLFG